jgi:hypothetical protein
MDFLLSPIFSESTALWFWNSKSDRCGILFCARTETPLSEWCRLHRHSILRMKFHPCPYIIGQFQGLKVIIIRFTYPCGKNIIFGFYPVKIDCLRWVFLIEDFSTAGKTALPTYKNGTTATCPLTSRPPTTRPPTTRPIATCPPTSRPPTTCPPTNLSADNLSTTATRPLLQLVHIYGPGPDLLQAYFWG